MAKAIQPWVSGQGGKDRLACEERLGLAPHLKIACPGSMAEEDIFGFVGYALEGRYRVDAVIGQGGFGVVYRGWHLAFDEPVAIKCLKIPPHFTEEARLVFEQRFRDEGKLLRKLAEKHSAVVRAHDVSVLASHGVPYLVLEWLDGWTLDRTLSERLARGEGPYSEQEAISLLTPAIEALALAHQGAVGQVIAHRDIKPENLFVLRDGGIKLLDFGIAKAMQEGEQLTQVHSRTSSGFSAFSPRYGAPEQFRPRKFGESGPWTDVHALGLVLAELVSGQPALGQGDYGDLSEAATAPLRPTPRKLGASVSEEFEVVCARALALQRSERFSDARELLGALQSLPKQPTRSTETRLPVATFLPGASPARPRPPSPAPAEAVRGSAVVSTNLPQIELFQPEARATPSPVQSSGPSPLRLLGGLGAALLVLGGVVLWRTLTPATAPTGVPLGAVEVPADRVSSGPASALSPRSAEDVAATDRILPVASAPPSIPVPPGMVLIRAGSFRMGAEGEGRTERPVHDVQISRDFFLDKTEVTVEAYLRCRAAGRCSASGIHGSSVSEEEREKYGKWCNEGRPERLQHPINCIDREQAAAYCAWAEKRLPTEAEWEFAARGFDERLYPWGTEPPSCQLGNFSAAGGRLCGSGGGTRAVGVYSAGAAPSGALDLAGNVWEWVEDGWDPNAYPATPQVDPVVPARGPQGVLRGGSWDFIAASAKTVTRQPFDRDKGHVSTGVRCAKDAR